MTKKKKGGAPPNAAAPVSVGQLPDAQAVLDTEDAMLADAIIARRPRALQVACDDHAREVARCRAALKQAERRADEAELNLRAEIRRNLRPRPGVPGLDGPVRGEGAGE